MSEKELGPTGAELQAILDACECTLVRNHPLWSGRTASEVLCPSHKHKVRLLAALAEWDSLQPRIIELARDIAGRTEGSREDIARAIHAWVIETIRFAPEPRELFRASERTIADRYGDCDDSARVLLALFRAAGFSAGLATLGEPPTHVAVAVRLGDRWLWAEPTIPGAQLGEHPREAVRRQLEERPDLGELGTVADEMRATIVEYAALSAVALAARAIWDRRAPTLAEAILTLSAGAWTPIVVLAARLGWKRISEGAPDDG